MWHTNYPTAVAVAPGARPHSHQPHALGGSSDDLDTVLPRPMTHRNLPATVLPGSV